jgi:hypothetical protein
MVLRKARAGFDLTAQVSFYNNGNFFDPFSVDDVKIYDAATGGTLQATLSVTGSAVGVYQFNWSVPLTQPAGTYYDEWTWVAVDGMADKVQRYSLTVNSNILPNYRGPPGIHTSPGRLFVGFEEVDFFNSITKELLQCIVGQKIIYYSISEEHTNTHRLYDEAIKKTAYRPVEVNALVLYNEPLQTATQFSIDTLYSIEVYFHIHELRERRIIPREGDFVKFGDILYEIEKLNKPQIVYGQVENQVMVKAMCRSSRKSQFEVLDSIQGR